MPDGDVSMSMGTFGSGTAGWDRIDNGIVSPGASPDDTNGILGLDGDSWRGSFTDPSFVGTCLEIKVHSRGKSDNAPGGYRLTLYSDGASSDGERPITTTGSFATYTETYTIAKTAAQLTDLEVRIAPDDASFDDRISEIEVEIVLTSSSSSSFSSSSFSSCSSSFSSSSSCSSSFSSSSSSFSSSSSSFSSSSLSSCSSSSSQSSSSSCAAGAWETHFVNDSTGWQCQANCSYNATFKRWQVAGPGMTMIVNAGATWEVGYRPQKVRITANHNLGVDWNLTVTPGIATVPIPSGGGSFTVEANCDFSGATDITGITESQAPGVGHITDIEFFVCGASFSSSSSSCSSSSESSSSSFSSSSSSFSSSSSESSSSSSKSSCSSSSSSCSSSSQSSSSSSAGLLHSINPNGDDSHNWLVVPGGAGYAAIDDWDSGSPAYLSDYIYGTSTAVGTEITDFENPSFGGTSTSIDVKLTWIGTSPFPTLGVSLYDGAVQIGSQLTDVGDGAWNPKTFNFVTSKTAAELTDLKVHFTYVSGSGTMAVAACQVDIKIDSESSSSSSSFSSSSSSCDSAFSSSSSSSSQSFSSSSSCEVGQWVQYFGLSYWVCLSNCNWDGDSYNTAGPGLAIRPVTGTWYVGQRWPKWRITVTGADTYSLRDKDGNTIASGAVTAGANEFDIDWSNNVDIGPSTSPSFLGRISNGAASDITNIEFFVCGSSSSSSSSFSSSSSSSSSSKSSSSTSSSFSSSSMSSSSGAADLFAVPNGDVSTGMTTFGSGSAHYDRINSGILSGTPDDTNGVEGEQGETDRWTFDQPSFNGVTERITLRARLKSTTSEGIEFTLYADGATSDGSKTWFPDDVSFKTFTHHFFVSKTAAELGNIEVRAIAQGAGGGIHDEVSEVELQFAFTSSVSSSSSSQSI